ncbi:MAG TPA: multicopper oxidase family protein [Micropepsaceae bacterium]|jgi:FtsP/CotA-like multicopper oxidase with cupredoxin domain|nr:multicopper oxidase family protein [Micropepsaceae bacterium]
MGGERPGLTRRALLAGSAAVTAAALTACGRGSTSADAQTGRLGETRIGGKPFVLTPREHPITLGSNKGPTPAWLYGDAVFPVYRLRLGESLEATLSNGLKEHTSVHWHGVRGPNAMDGVPYVTQMPVQPGETFTYRLTPPDAGTFFFHPHCNTVEQLGRGLAGVLIVEDGAAFDDDVVCVLKDWRVAKDGSFLPFLTLDGAARGGTFGTLRTVNGLAAPRIKVPPNANIRLRVLNLDSTRVSDIGLQGAEGSVIAIDGNALSPFTLDTWRMGPAMRMEVALRTPDAGSTVALVDFFAAEPVVLATLVAEGAGKPSSARTSALPAVTLSDADIANAETHELKLSASATASDYSGLAPIVLPDGRTIDVLDTLCSTQRTMWAIDGTPWPQTGHEHLPPPLMTLARGTSVRLRLTNTTPHVHPMHLHGHTFKVLSANKLKRPQHWADTVLVLPEERVEIAFVANNPGNWMIHCHIIEHQDTGMMAWFRVT